jgi:hypothetical protein
MSTYFVRTASIYRNAGILGVDILESKAHRGLKFEVVGEPDKRLKFRTARPVYDEAGKVLANRIFQFENS